MSAVPVSGPAPGEPSSMRRAIAFVYVGYAFRYLYLLILVPFYGRVLGAAEYGRVLAAMSLFQVVWALTEYALPTVGARDIAAARDSKTIAEIYGSQIMSRLLTTLPGLIVGLGGTLLSPLLRERPVFGLLATFNGIVQAYHLGWYFQGTLRFRTSVLLEVLGFTLNLPLVLLLVHGPNDGWRVLMSLLVSTVLSTLTAHAVALKSMNRAAIRWRGGKRLLKGSLALFAHKGLGMMMSSSSTYLISLVATAAQVGYYGAAERMISVGLSLLLPAHQVLFGTVSFRMSARESEDAAFALIRKALMALTVFGVLALLATSLCAGIAVPLILGPDFAPSVHMLQVLGLMFPFAAISQAITGYVLIPLRFDALVAKVSLFSAVTTVVLTVALGQAFGGMGVSWARTSGYALMALVLVEVVRRKQLAARVFTPRAAQPEAQ